MLKMKPDCLDDAPEWFFDGLSPVSCYHKPTQAMPRSEVIGVAQMNVRPHRDYNAVAIVFVSLRMKVSTIKQAVTELARDGDPDAPRLPPAFNELVRQLAAEWEREKGGLRLH